MWTLWGWNTWNGDYDAYQYRYENLTSFWYMGDYEYGYELLNIAFNSLRISYQGFMVVISFVTLYLIMFFSLKYSSYPALFAALYLVIFIMEYVYIRNYIVHALLFLAFMLVIEDVKHNKMWFAGIVLLAGSIHATAYLMIIFIYATFFDRIINIRKALLLIVGLIVMSVLMFNFLSPLLSPFYQEKIEFYSTHGGFTNVTFAHLLVVLFTYYFITLIFKYSDEIDEKQEKTLVLLANVNILSLMFLGMYYYIPYFARVLRFLFAFNLVFLLNGFTLVKIKSIRLLMLGVFCMIYFAVLIMFAKSTLSLTLYPLYLVNGIWGEQIYIPNFDFD